MSQHTWPPAGSLARTEAAAVCRKLCVPCCSSGTIPVLRPCNPKRQNAKSAHATSKHERCPNVRVISPKARVACVALQEVTNADENADSQPNAPTKLSRTVHANDMRHAVELSAACTKMLRRRKAVPNADQPRKHCTQRSFQPLYPACPRLQKHNSARPGVHWSCKLNTHPAQAYSRSPLATLTALPRMYNCHNPVAADRYRRTRKTTCTTEIRRIHPPRREIHPTTESANQGVPKLAQSNESTTPSVPRLVQS